MDLLLVEDNQNLRMALKAGLTDAGAVRVVFDCDSGEAALEYCLQSTPAVILMDVQLAGEMNGIEAAVAIRREYPRLPVVFYSIQDDDDYSSISAFWYFESLRLRAQIQLSAAANDCPPAA